jgi:hypothetical protein
VAIPLSIGIVATDPTDNEVQAVRVHGVPTGAVLSAGVNLGGGEWFLIPDWLPGLMITLPQDGVYDLTVEAQSGHVVSLDVASTFATIRVAVSNVAPVLLAPAAQNSRPGASATFDLGQFVDVAADALWQVEVDWGDGTKLTSVATTPGSLGAASHTYANHGRYEGLITITDKDGAVSRAPLPISVGPAEVRRVVANSGAAQRSRVTSLDVEFTGKVELAPDALTLRDQRGRVIPATVTLSEVNGVTQARLEFQGRGIVAGSLADGRYTLTVDGARVTNPMDDNQMIDADGDGIIGDLMTWDLTRRFGDLNGDGVVDRTDALAFRSSYGTRVGESGYLAAFDYTSNGVIGMGDLEQFVRRYRRR